MSMTSKSKPRGRRSDYRGDRVPVTTKLPRPYKEKLEAYAEATGDSMAEIIARSTIGFLDSVDLTDSTEQETLDLKIA